MEIPSTADYLDRLIRESLEKDRTLRYDSDLAAALSVSKTTISAYRHAHRAMSILVAVRVAELLNIHPLETIAATMASQASTEKDRAVWRHYYEQYQGR